MTSSYFIIGDVHGQLDTLKRLIANAPPHDRRIYLGDLVDRGPQCIETVQYVMDDVLNNGAVCLYGNHEDMMVQALYQAGGGRHSNVYLWMNNGGGPTFEGFKALPEDQQVAVLQWVQELPLYVEGPGFVASHAPIAQRNIEEVMSYLDRGSVGAKETFIWNRRGIKPWPEHIQFYGHNALYKEHTDAAQDGKIFAYCIDDTGNGNISGMHWPSRILYCESFMEDPTNEEAETETQVS